MPLRPAQSMMMHLDEYRRAFGRLVVAGGTRQMVLMLLILSDDPREPRVPGCATSLPRGRDDNEARHRKSPRSLSFDRRPPAASNWTNTVGRLQNAFPLRHAETVATKAPRR
jgi:hypothetical protein